MSLFSWLRVRSRLNRFDESRLVFFTARKIIFCDRSLNCLYLRWSSFCLAHNGSFIVWNFSYVCRFGTRHAVFSRRNNCLSCSSLVYHWYICSLCGLWLTRNSAYWCWHFFWGGLLLAFVATIEVSARFLFSRNCCLSRSFDCFLDSRRVFRRRLLRVWIWAANFFIETDDVAHALFKHGLLDAITTHCYKFIWPKLLKVTYFTSRHNNWACNDKCVILQKFKFFQAQTGENLAVVWQYLNCVWIGPHWTSKSISRKDDSLAEEMT